MINEHLPNCSCYDCLDKSVIGKFVTSSKPVTVYHSMGGEVRRVVKPNGFIGRVLNINSKGNWLYIKDFPNTTFVSVTPDLRFVVDESTLSDEQKKEVVINALKSQPGLAGASVEVGEKTIEAGKEVINFLPKLKWVIIGVIVLLVLILIVKIKS